MHCFAYLRCGYRGSTTVVLTMAVGGFVLSFQTRVTFSLVSFAMTVACIMKSFCGANPCLETMKVIFLWKDLRGFMNMAYSVC